jgi:putative ABC transport system permease protein
MLERRSIFEGHAFRSRAMSGVIGDHGFEIGRGRAPSRLGEAMVGFGFLKEYGIEVGDTIDFAAGSTPVRVTITGWYRETDDSGRILVYGLDTLRAGEPGATSDSWQVVARRGISGDALAAALGSRLGTGVRVMPRSVGDVGLGTFKAAMAIVALLVALVAGAQLLATTVASARERARDVGVLRAVGATTKGLLGQHALTAALLGMVAVVVGLPLGLALFRLLSDAVSEGIGVGPGFGGSPTAAAAGIIAVLTVVFAAGIGALAVAGLVRRPASELVRWE